MNVRMLLMAAVIYSCSAVAMESENARPIESAMHNALSAACDRFENQEAKFIIKVASCMATLFFPKSIGIINNSADELKTHCRQVRSALEENHLNQSEAVDACECALKAAHLKFCVFKNILRSGLVPQYRIDGELAQSLNKSLMHDSQVLDEAQNCLALLDEWNAAVTAKSQNESKSEPVKKYIALSLPLKIQLKYRPDLTDVSAKMAQLKQLVKEIQSNP